MTYPADLAQIARLLTTFQLEQEDHVGDATLTSVTVGKLHTNIGAAQDVTLTLPAAESGAFGVFYASPDVGYSLILDAAGTDNIDQSAAGGTVSYFKAGVIFLDCIEDGIWTATVDKQNFGLAEFNVRDARFGAVGDGLNDDTAAIQACRTAAAGAGAKATVIFPPGEYLVSDVSLFLLFSDLEIEGYGATIVFNDSGATRREASPVDSVIYYNGLFYVLTPTISNVAIRGLRFEITDDDVGPIQIGSSSHTSGAISGYNVAIEDIEQEGGNSVIVHRIDRLRVENTRQIFTYSGHYIINNTNFRWTNNFGDHIGVSADELTWNNTAGLVCNNNRNMLVAKNQLEVTGGTAILCRSSNEIVSNATFSNNNIVRAGLGGLSVRTFTGTAKTLRNVVISNNNLQGWQCSVNTASNPHDGISGGSNTSGGVCDGLTITGNTVSFVGDTETWDTVNYDVDGSASPDKVYNQTGVTGTLSGINVVGGAGAVNYNVTVTGNAVAYAPGLGITVSYTVSGTVSGNSTRLCGYYRIAGVPPASAHAIFVTDSAFVDVIGNTCVEQNPGSDGTSARTNVIQFTNPLKCKCFGNIIIGNDTTTYTSAWNNRAISLTGGSAWAAVTGINTTTASLPSLEAGSNTVRGTRFGLYAPDGGHYGTSSTFVLTVRGDDYVAVTTGSTTIDNGVTQVRKDATGAQTITLPDPSTATGSEVTVRNSAASDDITMAAAAGTITATTLAPEASAMFRARGTVWERVA